MKKLYILLFACAALMACEKKDRSDEGYINGGPPGPPGYLIVVQMPDAQQTQTAIVENPVVRVDYSTWPETPIFDENVLEPKVSDLLSTWPKDSLKMLEHSPYIELGDNYYLLDWRWRGALPFLSRLINWYCGPDSIFIAHWFVTDVEWKDISLLQDWSKAQIIGHPNVTAMGIISPERLDEYFGTLIPRDNPYWVTVYWSGGPRIGYNTRITTREYIDFLNQLQERYRDYLIQLIQEGKFNEFYYQP